MINVGCRTEAEKKHLMLTTTGDETLMTPGGNKTRPKRSHEGVAEATLPSWIVKVKSHIRGTCILASHAVVAEAEAACFILIM